MIAGPTEARTRDPEVTGFLRVHKAAVMQRWHERVRELPAAGLIEEEALRDHVAELVERIGVLADKLHRGETAAFPERLAEIHALDRLGEGFDLVQLLIEYSLLRTCIVGVWEEERGAGAAGTHALHRAIDLAAAAAAARYTQARDRTLELVDRVSAAALQSRDLDDLLRRILEALVRTDPSVDIAAILLRDGPVLRGRAGVGLEESVVRRLKARVASGATEPGATLPIAAADQILRACVPEVRGVHAVALKEGERLVGSVILGSSTADAFADQDLRLFEAIANRATSAIAQHLLRQDLERRAAELETVIQSIPAAVYIGNEGGVTRMNARALEMLGVRSAAELEEGPEERLARLGPRDPATGAPIPREELLLARALEGAASSREMVVGTDVYLHADGAPIVEGEAVVGAVVVFHDLTSHMKAEEQLRHGEERLRLALEATQLGTWDWDLTEGGGHWSPRYREIHGIDPGESVAYERFLASIHPADRPAVERAVADATRACAEGMGGAAEGASYDVEYRVAPREGLLRWVAARGRCFFDGPGEPRRAVRMIGTALDVTERRHAREAERLLSDAGRVLAESLDYRETLGRIAKLAIPLLADGCAVDVVVGGGIEQVALEHADAEKVDLAREIRTLFPPVLDDPRGVGRVLQTGECELYETMPDGLLAESAAAERLRALGLESVMIVPMIARRRIVGALSFAVTGSGRRYGRRDLAVASELADRAALALDNARLFEQSEAAVRSREAILAVVSHDLRSPLGSIDIAARLIGDRLGSAEPFAERQVATIRRSTRRMARLIGDLQDMASIQARRLAIEPASHDVSDIMRESAERVDGRARERGITFGCDAAPRGARVMCDRERILQVLGNLLENSLKFCEPGASAMLSAVREGDRVRFQVSDTGPGIHESDRSRVFDQCWSAELKARSGTGLGLYIARGIVEAHGGRLELASELGRGTSVAFTLPLEAGDAEAAS